jgi:hypothetical protein
MTALRICLTVSGATILSGFIVALAALASTVIAVATKSAAGVPGLVAVTPGHGADLATTQFISPGSGIWFAALTIAISTMSLLAIRWGVSRRGAGLPHQP